MAFRSQRRWRQPAKPSHLASEVRLVGITGCQGGICQLRVVVEESAQPPDALMLLGAESGVVQQQPPEVPGRNAERVRGLVNAARR